MKTVGVRNLVSNPGILSKSAEKGESVLLLNRSRPMSLSIPFDDELVNSGAHIRAAISLFEDGTLTLNKAAALAKMPVETFMETLGLLGVVAVDQQLAELNEDLDTIGG